MGEKVKKSVVVSDLLNVPTDVLSCSRELASQLRQARTWLLKARVPAEIVYCPDMTVASNWQRLRGYVTTSTVVWARRKQGGT